MNVSRYSISGSLTSPFHTRAWAALAARLVFKILNEERPLND